jgi:heme/copper-type cytochrome/quinol oxidase subunit 2
VTWVFSVISIIVGGIGTSICFYLLTNNDIFSTEFKDLSILQTLIIAVPFFWIIISVFFLFLAFYNFKHTEGGYKWNVAKLFIINILASLVIGLTLYSTGASGALNDVFSGLPFYSQIADVRDQVWMRPESGYLAGDIVAVNINGKEITIKDLNNKSWTVDITDALIRPSVSLNAGSRIKIIGEKTSENKFTATEIRPWTGMMQMGRMLGVNNVQENPLHKRIK